MACYTMTIGSILITEIQIDITSKYYWLKVCDQNLCTYLQYQCQISDQSNTNKNMKPLPKHGSKPLKFKSFSIIFIIIPVPLLWAPNESLCLTWRSAKSQMTTIISWTDQFKLSFEEKCTMHEQFKIEHKEKITKLFQDQLIALYIHAAELLKLKMVKTEIFCSKKTHFKMHSVITWEAFQYKIAILTV